MWVLINYLTKKIIQENFITMKKIINNVRKQVWVLFLPAMMAVVGALGAAQPAAASMPIEIKEVVIKADVQEVDADGDGQTEPFSAYAELYTGGKARGSVSVGSYNLTLKRGVMRCMNGVDTVIFEGPLYQHIGGVQVLMGDGSVHFSRPRGNGGGGGDLDLDFDIINNVLSFEVIGAMVMENSPCSS
jgi:hypothetical protein